MYGNNDLSNQCNRDSDIVDERCGEKTLNLTKITFSQICYRWTQCDLRIIFLQTFCKNFDFSIHKINFPFSDHHTFSRKFTRNFPKFSLKFFGKFPIPHHPRIHPPMLYTHTQPPTPWTHLELQLRFSRKYKSCVTVRFLNCTFNLQ